MGNNYTGFRYRVRWVAGHGATRYVELVLLDVGLRAVLSSLWRAYNCREKGGYAAARMAWLTSDVCFDLFALEHIHTDECLRGGDCPIWAAGFEEAQDTVKDWQSERRVYL